MDRDRIGTSTFNKLFGTDPAFFVRAPGRINLIGEHIDYSNCPVLPAAVNREIIAAVHPREDNLIEVHAEGDGFPPRRFSISQTIPPFDTGDWGNYIKAGVQGILDWFLGRDKALEQFSGMNILVQGDIPLAAGMSSSSALVVLSALVFLRVNNLSIDTLKLAELLAGAEHYVGTKGGGMDQAAILFGKKNHAVFINFNPLQVEYVPVPEEYVFIVADSTIKAPKSREALDKYNRRTIECRLAASVIRRTMESRFKREFPITVLGDLNPETLGVTRSDLDGITGNLFHLQPYTLAEVAALLGIAPDSAAREYCLRKDGTLFPEPEGGFKLNQRFTHVMEEWERVLRSVEVLKQAGMDEFGALMYQSHESCRDLYEISVEELDVLVEIFRTAGALGSRLTGAGFGGCAVSLVRKADENRILEEVAELYYREYLGLEDPDLPALLFSCSIEEGANYG